MANASLNQASSSLMDKGAEGLRAGHLGVRLAVDELCVNLVFEHLKRSGVSG